MTVGLISDPFALSVLLLTEPLTEKGHPLGELLPPVEIWKKAHIYLLEKVLLAFKFILWIQTTYARTEHSLAGRRFAKSKAALAINSKPN